MDFKKLLPQNINTMGVINITPNSFSDGGVLNSSDSVLAEINKMYSVGVRIFDIGAESTAPFNEKIELFEEMTRFKNLFYPIINKLPSDITITVDTYRGQTFSNLYNEISKSRDDIEIWWNDVSGVLDDCLTKTMIDCPKAKYVFCHANNASREDASSHMERVQESFGLDDYFHEGIKFFKSNNFTDRLILDPCFGFSKNIDQNLALLANIRHLINAERYEGIPFLIGVSRKSFFKKSTIEEYDQNLQIEMMQSNYLFYLMKQSISNKLIIRLHDPSVIFSAAFMHSLTSN